MSGYDYLERADAMLLGMLDCARAELRQPRAARERGEVEQAALREIELLGRIDRIKAAICALRGALVPPSEGPAGVDHLDPTGRLRYEAVADAL